MRKQSFFCLCGVLCFLALLLASCGGGGGSGSFVKDAGDPDVPSTEGVTKWTFTAGGALNSSAARADDGTLYIGSEDGALYAIAPNGSLKWKFQTGAAIVASPAIGEDGMLYVGSMDRQLYAIRPDGTLKWVLPTKSNFTASPAIGADGTVYAAGRHQDIPIICNGELPIHISFLYAVTPDGLLKWQVTLSGFTFSSPAIAADGTIYIASNGDIEFDRVDPCDKKSDYLPSNIDPNYYPANAHLYAIRPDGSIKWRFGAIGDIDSSPAIGSDGTIYIGSDYRQHTYGETKNKVLAFTATTEGYLYAITPTGVLKWIIDLYGDVDSSPAVAADGTIYVGSDKNDVFALNPNGTIKWVFPTRGDVNAGPAIASDGAIFIGSNDKILYVLNPDGTKRWSFEATAAIDSSASIGPDNIVYFGSSAGVLYSIGTAAPLMDSPWPKFRQNLRNTGRKLQ